MLKFRIEWQWDGKEIKSPNEMFLSGVTLPDTPAVGDMLTIWDPKSASDAIKPCYFCFGKVIARKFSDKDDVTTLVVKGHLRNK